MMSFVTSILDSFVVARVDDGFTLNVLAGNLTQLMTAVLFLRLVLGTCHC